MSVLTTDEIPTRSYRDLLRTTPWTDVLALTVLVAYVDGFVMVSLRGAVGYIGRAQGPFATWALHSTLSLPLFAVAVWGAFLLARRRATGRHPLAVTAGFVALTTGAAAIVVTAANAVYDYQLQVQQMSVMMQSGIMATGMQSALDDSLAIQVKAMAVVSVVLLVGNLLLAGWFAALRGGRLFR